MQVRTTTKLIEELRDPGNSEAWSGFDQRYRPVLVGLGRAMGLSADAAAELAQQALVEFSVAYRAGKYDRERGRLSSWLIGIARNIAVDMRRRIGPRAGGPPEGLSGIASELPDEARLTRVWARERQSAILVEAMAVLWNSHRMEAHTMRAFELFVVRGVPAASVAAECGISVDAVYVIKNRLTTRLREIVRDLTAAHDQEG